MGTSAESDNTVDEERLMGGEHRQDYGTLSDVPVSNHGQRMCHVVGGESGSCGSMLDYRLRSRQVIDPVHGA